MPMKNDVENLIQSVEGFQPSDDFLKVNALSGILDVLEAAVLSRSDLSSLKVQVANLAANLSSNSVLGQASLSIKYWLDNEAGKQLIKVKLQSVQKY